MYVCNIFPTGYFLLNTDSSVIFPLFVFPILAPIGLTHFTFLLVMCLSIYVWPDICIQGNSHFYHLLHYWPMGVLLISPLPYLCLSGSPCSIFDITPLAWTLGYSPFRVITCISFSLITIGCLWVSGGGLSIPNIVVNLMVVLLFGCLVSSPKFFLLGTLW